MNDESTINALQKILFPAQGTRSLDVEPLFGGQHLTVTNSFLS